MLKCIELRVFFLLLRLTVQNVLVFWRHDLFIYIMHSEMLIYQVGYTSKVEDINREESLNSFNGWLTLWTSSSAIGQLSRSRLICCGQGWASFLLKTLKWALKKVKPTPTVWALLEGAWVEDETRLNVDGSSCLSSELPSCPTGGGTELVGWFANPWQRKTITI